MAEITIFFGTESGNAEMVADDISDALADHGFETTIVAMENASADDLDGLESAVFITSTYGEGDLPATTAPFAAALTDAAPSLHGLRFAAFGLGDSTYATYNNAVVKFSALLESLGASRATEIGRHDATSGVSATDASTAWTNEHLVPALNEPALACPFGHTA